MRRKAGKEDGLRGGGYKNKATTLKQSLPLKENNGTRKKVVLEERKKEESKKREKKRR